MVEGRIFEAICLHTFPTGNDPLELPSVNQSIDSRDPHSIETLERFGQCTEYFASGKFTEKDVDEAKLATFQKVGDRH